MIFDNSPQGSDDWLLARCGVITASNFNCIITPTGKATTGAKADTYMRQLLAEWLLGKPVDTFEPTQWMQRGNELEPQARDLYQLIKDVEVHEAGLCYLDDKKLVGASLDGLIGDKGSIEIKCPKASTMIAYMLDGLLPATYKPQVQGQLWVSQREYSDFFAYHPDMEPYIVRVNRDEKYIKSLSELTDSFIDEMLEKREQLGKSDETQKQANG